MAVADLLAFAAAAASAVGVAASAVVVAVDGIGSSEPGPFVIVAAAAAAAVDVSSVIFAADSRTWDFGVTEQRAFAAVRVEPAVFDSVGAGMIVNWDWLFPTSASAIAAAPSCQLVHFGPNPVAENS